MRRCKITVLKTLYLKELAEAYPPYEKGPCEICREGAVFYTTGPFGVDMPEGFCPPAWTSLATFANVLASGGRIYSRDDVHVTSCPDGVRPVIFRMEACED